MNQRLEEIENKIKNDPQNIHKTKENISPLYNVTTKSKIIIIGQAPGIKAEVSGQTWNDLSGDKLRQWLGVDRNLFYDPNIFGQLPMDFYYPGKGKYGDLPPRKGFAEKWHPEILSELHEIKLIILIGSYAQNYYLKDHLTLTERVKNYQKYLPKYFVLPHPSPLNFRWMNKNPWFLNEVIPNLQEIINKILQEK